MKKLLLILLFLSPVFSEAQVLCIRCYDQNARVLPDTNNLIVNGGFENTTCIGNQHFCPSSTIYSCDIANWTCTGGGYATYAHMSNSTFLTLYSPFSIIAEGIKSVYFGNNFCYACSPNISDTSCIISTDCEVTDIPAGYPINGNSGYGRDTGVSLSQTVNGLTIGSIYQLEFWAGGESDSLQFNSDGLFAVDIGFGNIFLRDPPTPPAIGIGRRFVIVFAADSSSDIIKFTNWGHLYTSWDENFTELVLDDVRLFAAREASNPCATSINKLALNAGLSFSPNPAHNILNVQCTLPNGSKGSPTAELKIYDMMGREVMEEHFDKLSAHTFNLQLSGGVYFVKVSDGDRVAVQKLIVE